MSRIIKVQGSKVALSHGNSPDLSLQMDFQPIINAAKRLTGNQPFSFVHWQAKPFGLRTWGVFTVDELGNTNYISARNIDVDALTQPTFLQIDERAFNVKPTAGLLYINTTATESNGRIRITGNGRNTINDRKSNNSLSLGGISDSRIAEHNQRIERAKARVKASRRTDERS